MYDMKTKQLMFRACELLDSSLFSSDFFHNRDNLGELKKYLYRWNREVQDIEKILKEGRK